MSNDSMDEVIAKIQKVLSRTTAKGASEEEAATAMRIAQKLCMQYNLDMAEIEAASTASDKNAPAERIKEEFKGRARFQWQRQLAKYVAEANFCYHIVYRNREYRRARQDADGNWINGITVTTNKNVFVGRRGNVVTAQLMYAYLTQAVEDNLPSEHFDHTQRLSRGANSWKEGCADRLCARLAQKRADLIKEHDEKVKAAQGSSMSTYPIVFTFRDKIAGKGFMASVAANGRALLCVEDDEFWLYGVQPGAVAGGAASREAAFADFKQNYLGVLFDIAEEADSFDLFRKKVVDFFNEVTQSRVDDWADALRGVRSGSIKLDGLEEKKNADKMVPDDAIKARADAKHKAQQLQLEGNREVEIKHKIGNIDAYDLSDVNPEHIPTVQPDANPNDTWNPADVAAQAEASEPAPSTAMVLASVYDKAEQEANYEVAHDIPLGTLAERRAQQEEYERRDAAREAKCIADAIDQPVREETERERKARLRAEKKEEEANRRYWARQDAKDQRAWEKRYERRDHNMYKLGAETGKKIGIDIQAGDGGKAERKLLK